MLKLVCVLLSTLVFASVDEKAYQDFQNLIFQEKPEVMSFDLQGKDHDGKEIMIPYGLSLFQKSGLQILFDSKYYSFLKGKAYFKGFQQSKSLSYAALLSNVLKGKGAKTLLLVDVDGVLLKGQKENKGFIQKLKELSKDPSIDIFLFSARYWNSLNRVERKLKKDEALLKIITFLEKQAIQGFPGGGRTKSYFLEKGLCLVGGKEAIRCDSPVYPGLRIYFPDLYSYIHKGEVFYTLASKHDFLKQYTDIYFLDDNLVQLYSVGAGIVKAKESGLLPNLTKIGLIHIHPKKISFEK